MRAGNKEFTSITNALGWNRGRSYRVRLQLSAGKSNSPWDGRVSLGHTQKGPESISCLTDWSKIKMRIAASKPNLYGRICLDYFLCYTA